jgi:hypothetical protein
MGNVYNSIGLKLRCEVELWLLLVEATKFIHQVMSKGGNDLYFKLDY